jgi:Arc/MetJ-type ribon-helix-helix transcriptional regulator
MTPKPVILHVRVPGQLIRQIDRMIKTGLDASRSEAILDPVRRMAMGYERSDRFRRALIRSYSGMNGRGSVDDPAVDHPDVVSAIRDVNGSADIVEIISRERIPGHYPLPYRPGK